MADITEAGVLELFSFCDLISLFNHSLIDTFVCITETKKKKFFPTDSILSIVWSGRHFKWIRQTAAVTEWESGLCKDKSLQQWSCSIDPGHSFEWLWVIVSPCLCEGDVCVCLWQVHDMAGFVWCVILRLGTKIQFPSDFRSSVSNV